MSPTKHLARAIRSARLLRGLTLAQAAELVGVHPQSWHRWEAGSQSPSALQVALIVHQLQAGAAEFVPPRKSFGPLPQPAPLVE